MDGTSLMIDLGTGNPEEGEIRPEGYIYQDIEPHKGIDLVCDILDLDKHIKPGQCKRIRMSHVLEHFPTKVVLPLLKMLYTLIEDGGAIIIDVPNFCWHASLLLFDQDEEAVTYAYGGQRDQYDYHKTAFTPEILYKRLVEAGFQNIDIKVEHSLHAFAVKHGKPKPN